jgi:hypothetical protein
MADWTPEEHAELEKIVGEIKARDKEQDKKSQEGSEDGEDSEHAEDEQG